MPLMLIIIEYSSLHNMYIQQYCGTPSPSKTHISHLITRYWLMAFSYLRNAFDADYHGIFKSTWYIHPTMLWNPPLSLQYSWQSHLITRYWLMWFSNLKNAFDADYHGIFKSTWYIHPTMLWNPTLLPILISLISLQDMDWWYFRI